uniref:Uncharacterized protein n=1 Tax=Ectopseudomonas mendocina (strain ymp) TaxID=399739 RepID=A4XZH1_ECTM1
MELTTPQIYGIFAALSCAAIAGLIFYCIGLRSGKATGYEQGHNVAKNYWRKIVGNVRADLGEARDLLDARTREMAALRQSIEQETADHGKVERDLLNRLAAAAPLSDEDHAVLIAVVAKLELAADTFAGLNSPDHARFSRHLQAQVLDIADRIKKAQANTQPHPDSELIEWLEASAEVSFDLEQARITFGYDLTQPHPIVDDIRSVVRHAMEQSERQGFDAADVEDAA